MANTKMTEKKPVLKLNLPQGYILGEGEAFVGIEPGRDVPPHLYWAGTSPPPPEKYGPDKFNDQEGVYWYDLSIRPVPVVKKASLVRGQIVWTPEPTHPKYVMNKESDIMVGRIMPDPDYIATPSAPDPMKSLIDRSVKTDEVLAELREEQRTRRKRK